jgi:hypothetical protein
MGAVAALLDLMADCCLTALPALEVADVAPPPWLALAAAPADVNPDTLVFFFNAAAAIER